MNDLVVAERQKHNGMSWSKEGSVALASITALKRNNESRKWFEEKELDFRLVAKNLRARICTVTITSNIKW